MKSITKTELGAGSGFAAAIARGKSFCVTQRGEPLATLRPHREDDKGEAIDSTELYSHAGRYIDRAHEGETIIVLKKSEPFATIVKYKNRTRAKRQPKARAKPTPPATTQEQPEEPSTLRDAILLLEAADQLPPKQVTKLLQYSAGLDQKGKLLQALRLLELLME